MEYKIIGENLPAVICDVEDGETLLCEGGAMSWMTPNMVMQTATNGGVKKAFGRIFSGESFFQNRYTAQGGPGKIAFASSFPGSIKAYEIDPDHEIVCQKTCFLASEEGVELSVFFQKKIGAGLFGGEGFIMQKLSGHGTAFLEIDGSICRYHLEAGQQLIVDTGYLAVMDATCSMDIQTVPGVKNMFFGGEGVFNTIITGPGDVLLQTMPKYQMAGAISPFIASSD
jgi:uncharacterized protein (TIGR00266 family)